MPARPTRWGERNPLPAGLNERFSEVSSEQCETVIPVQDYDLDATLDSGQVFRWRKQGDAWHGILEKHYLQLTQTDAGIHAVASTSITDWTFLRRFLQTDLNLAAVLKTFPDDEPMRAAVASCRGLRLLRQDPWECLASFILSSTKQIVQIRQIIALLCQRFGDSLQQTFLNTGLGTSHIPTKISNEPCWKPALPNFTFPTPHRLAACTEAELRDCKMGFRAPSLLAAARAIADGTFDLEHIQTLDYANARTELMKLRGVGGKIADCVLLFAYGFDSAFPVDVWVERAVQELYFPRRRASRKRLLKFASAHFGPNAGYAQQYLFHYMRTKLS